MIQKIGEFRYRASSGRRWIPGVYHDPRTAQYAYLFTDDVLEALQKSINPNGVITWDMLREIKRNSV